MQDMQSVDSSGLTDVVRKAVHDIRGPVINVRGFSDQLDAAVEELVLLLHSRSSDLPDDVRDRVNEIVEDDINPGLVYLRVVLTQLESRIDGILPDAISAIKNLEVPPAT